MIKNQSAPQLSPIKAAVSNKANMHEQNRHKIELDPSIEQSLDKLNDFDNQSKRIKSFAIRFIFWFCVHN